MLQIQNLCKRYSNKVLFEGASIVVPHGGKIALVGANGAGKTTLLNIICKLEQQDQGQIIFAKDSRIGFLPQEPDPCPEATVLSEVQAGLTFLFQQKKRLHHLAEELKTDHRESVLAEYENAESEFRTHGGYGMEANAQRLLSGLGFSESHKNADPKTLSGGWRMRVELAKVLIASPDILILDEPTNHLDLPALVWVESWLKTFTGTLIFVSHDRSLLNRLSTHTLHLQGGNLRLYSGCFDDFLVQKDLETKLESKTRAKLEKRISDHQSFVDRFGAKASKAKQAQSRLKMIERLQALEQGLTNVGGAEGRVMSLSIPEPTKPGRMVLQVEDLAIGYQADHPLACSMDLEIERGQKVAVIGANGIGKSTFLQTVFGLRQALNGQVSLGHQVKVGYFSQDQNQSLQLDKDLLENLMSFCPDLGQKDARKLLGRFLFSGEDIFKKVSVLSGGEKNRLGMGCLLGQGCNFLLLDEPTNHLDMASVEILITSLQELTVTMLFVSHDREFINSVCDHVFVMLPDGRSRLFLGDLEDYQRLAEIEGFPNIFSEDVATPQSSQQKIDKKSDEGGSSGLSEKMVKSMRSRRKSLLKQCQILESQQNSFSLKIKDLETQMLKTLASDYRVINDLKNEKNQIVAQMTSIDESWLEALDEIEQIEKTLIDNERGF